MYPSDDMFQQITGCVQEVSQEIVMSLKEIKELDDSAITSASQHFMKLFQSNLTTAINAVYFDENSAEMQSDVTGSQPSKDNIEYEKVIMDIIGKRRQGTKVCKDVLEKTLQLEKKNIMAIDVAQGAVNVQKFGKQQGPCKKEDLKLGAKKTSEHLRTSAQKVTELNDRAEELIKAAVIYKEIDQIDDY